MSEFTTPRQNQHTNKRLISSAEKDSPLTAPYAKLCLLQRRIVAVNNAVGSYVELQAKVQAAGRNVVASSAAFFHSSRDLGEVEIPLPSAVHLHEDLLGQMPATLRGCHEMYFQHHAVGGAGHHLLMSLREQVCRDLDEWKEEIDEIHGAVKQVKDLGATHTYYVEKMENLQKKFIAHETVPDDSRINHRIDRNTDKLAMAAKEYYTSLAQVCERVEEALQESDTRLQHIVASFTMVDALFSARRLMDAGLSIQAHTLDRFAGDGSLECDDVEDVMEDAEAGVEKFLAHRVHFQGFCRKKQMLSWKSYFAVAQGPRLELYLRQEDFLHGLAPQLAMLVENAEFYGNDDSDAVKVYGMQEADRSRSACAVLAFGDAFTAHAALKAFLKAGNWRTSGQNAGLAAEIKRTIAFHERTQSPSSSPFPDRPESRTPAAVAPAPPTHGAGLLFKGGVSSRLKNRTPAPPPGSPPTAAQPAPPPGSPPAAAQPAIASPNPFQSEPVSAEDVAPGPPTGVTSPNPFQPASETGVSPETSPAPAPAGPGGPGGATSNPFSGGTVPAAGAIVTESSSQGEASQPLRTPRRRVFGGRAAIESDWSAADSSHGTDKNSESGSTPDRRSSAAGGAGGGTGSSAESSGKGGRKKRFGGAGWWGGGASDAAPATAAESAANPFAHASSPDLRAAAGDGSALDFRTDGAANGGPLGGRAVPSFSDLHGAAADIRDSMEEVAGAAEDDAESL
eukprot:scaffold1655_cov247-Pinguiococcus_pyrenoidosus.AAC.6